MAASHTRLVVFALRHLVADVSPPKIGGGALATDRDPVQVASDLMFVFDAPLISDREMYNLNCAWNPGNAFCVIHSLGAQFYSRTS
ncbi:hypothetical protein PTI98_009658 [Pleurotus ostreatus]|nr:hypothetical protein PTI98_009658 [Pleurotus ostreatus]